MHCLLILPTHTKSSNFQGEKTDYTAKIQELQKQLTLDTEEAQKIQVCIYYLSKRTQFFLQILKEVHCLPELSS
jgi:hypothetical protein